MHYLESVHASPCLTSFSNCRQSRQSVLPYIGGSIREEVVGLMDGRRCCCNISGQCNAYSVTIHLVFEGAVNGVYRHVYVHHGFLDS